MTSPSKDDAELKGARAVDRALSLLSMVGRHAERGAGLTDLVVQSGSNKPTVRRLLLALMRAGLVDQDERTRRYYLGEEAYVLGTLSSRRFGLLQMAQDGLRRISRRTEDSSFLSVRRDTFSLCLYREEGTWPVRTHALQAGFEHPLGIGAGSLAMLSALPDPEIDQVLAANADVIASKYPMINEEDLRRGVEETRAKGFSLNPGLILANSWGVGVAIRNPDGSIAGALSIAAIDSRVRPERQPELAGVLREEVDRIEARIGEMMASRSPSRAEPDQRKSLRRASR
ncbi:IclR family transcriptional regulator [Rhizobium sp. SL86]|uniref:IclR family transcriptional regulator n=1 Tax=Rhizobium sp. SL86 TaxID=2995148 RepID=UPI002272A049|nr:IclR family transcriptional regulator [Rhizobium sp. SL86]MCY1667264.1 IclR family transcriptional regulator [Rhizobium sp. SL86]